MKIRPYYSILLGLLLAVTVLSFPGDKANQGTEKRIEDLLLSRLAQQKVLVLPECLSHDSYDAIQLPIRLIEGWLKNNHGIKKLIVGLERETSSKEFELVRSNKYYLFERSATICPSAWGLFSTRNLNLNLVLREILNKAPGRFLVFGFENSYHYYNPRTDNYLLPSQIDTSERVDKVDYFSSKAPMVVRYAYSKFFRDHLSFSTIKGVIEQNPDAHILIIVGNAHTLKEVSFNDTDRQIIDAYRIDTGKYTHWLGYFLKQDYPTLFVQSAMSKSSAVTRKTLIEYNGESSEFPWLKNFYTDYHYVIPAGPDVNLEEPPLVCIPSSQNLSLLQHKRFQIYPSQELCCANTCNAPLN